VTVTREAPNYRREMSGRAARARVRVAAREL
jgi:hypothetical protein